MPNMKRSHHARSRRYPRQNQERFSRSSAVSILERVSGSDFIRPLDLYLGPHAGSMPFSLRPQKAQQGGPHVRQRNVLLLRPHGLQKLVVVSVIVGLVIGMG